MLVQLITGFCEAAALEPVGLADHPGGEDAAARAAGDEQVVGIGDAA